MVDLSLDDYSADNSGDKDFKDKPLKETVMQSEEQLDELKVKRKKRTKKLKLEDSDYSTDDENISENENLKGKSNTIKKQSKKSESDQKNEDDSGKCEGDSEVSGVSSDSSSGDESDNDFIQKLLKKKNTKESEIEKSEKDTSEKDTSLNSSPIAKETKIMDSSEDEMYDELVKKIPSKKLAETKSIDKDSNSRGNARKKIKKKIESDDSDNDSKNGEEELMNLSEHNEIEDKLQNISDDEIIGEEDLKDLERDKEFLDEKDIKPRKKRQAAKESEKVMKEIRSEQQRLQRERACEIPYHEPKAKSVKEFLKRVPSLPNRKSKNHGNEKVINLEENKTHETSKKQSIFSKMPVLAQSCGDLEFFMEDEDHDSAPSAPKPVKRVDCFMDKVVKQIKTPVSEKKKTDNSNEKAWSNTQLKSKLRGKIKERRQRQYEEIEEKRKKLEDQIALEEGEESYDEADSDSSQSGAESEDEEIEKWNVEENRIRLEEDIEEQEKIEKNESDQEKVDTSNDKETEDMEMEENDESNIDFKKVPTQLLKSDLLHSNSNDDCVKKDSPLVLPCENTQDLYKDDSRISSIPDEEDEDSDTELGPNFHLSLDEDTQFTQHILDSQGFLTTKKQVPKEKAKIFEEKSEGVSNNSFSMTQMLGLCSGKFSGDFPSTNISPSQSIKKSQSSIDFQDDNANSTFSNFTFSEHKEEKGSLSNVDSNTENLPTNESVENNSNSKDEEEISNGIVYTNESEDNKDKFEKIEENGFNNEDRESRNNTEEPFEEKEEEEEEEEEGDVTEENEDEGSNEGEGNIDDNIEEGPYEDGEEPEEENEELKEWNLHVQNKSEKKKWKKKAFYEDEAELSGSDVGSDDEDLGSEFDEYEEDSDFEDLPDDEKLKKQLHKIHQKKMNDQDKREMRLLQELYLEDEFGDGERRKRNFRWRNIDEKFNEENVSNDVDEADNYSELKERNLELVERNKFLLEMEESQSQAIELDENSQMVLEKINGPGTKVSSGHPISAVDMSQKIAPLRRSGSFLRDVKNSKSSPITNLPKVNVNKNAKSFVFQALNEPKKVKKNVDDKHAPPRKRARNENTPQTNTTSKLTPSSIFSLL